jgi:hypothetical protein
VVAESILCVCLKGYIFSEWLVILSFTTAATTRYAVTFVCQFETGSDVDCRSLWETISCFAVSQSRISHMITGPDGHGLLCKRREHYQLCVSTVSGIMLTIMAVTMCKVVSCWRRLLQHALECVGAHAPVINRGRFFARRSKRKRATTFRGLEIVNIVSVRVGW